jgi:hypothetical protein
VSYRSTALITLVVFGILFALLYSSAYVSTKNKETLLLYLQSGRADSYIARMVNPEDVCFSADQRLLDRHPSLVRAIDMADEQAGIHATTDGNYYNGVETGLSKTEMLSFLREYNFNLTTSLEQTPNKLFTHQNKYLTCGFSYSDKHYQLAFSFTSLESVNRDRGYVPIMIDQRLVDKLDSPVTQAFTHAPFNNTAVFFNKLGSTVTVEMTNKDTGDLETVTIRPNKMSDMRITPDFNSLDDIAYHYNVMEYPWIEGDIIVSIAASSDCMNKDVAKSLYFQSDFDVKFPTYLPSGFKLACNVEVLDNLVVEIYVNQTAIDYHKKTQIFHSRNNPYPIFLYSSTPKVEAAGIIEIYAQKVYEGNANSTGVQFYQELEENSNYKQPSFSVIGETSYLTYYDGQLSVVNVYMEDESYRLVGIIPMHELVSTAQSMFEKQ